MESMGIASASSIAAAISPKAVAAPREIPAAQFFRSVACRTCSCTALETILDYGELPLANALLGESQLHLPEPRYPLTLAFCPRCSLVQILETVAPAALFRDYVYFSSASDTMVRHARDLARRMLGCRSLGEKSLVVEIASNDGYLLQHYRHAGVPVIGIEPARNVARVAREQRGICTISEFFGRDLANHLNRGAVHADVVHAHNVLAHVADADGFVEGVRLILKEGGVAIIEVPYACEMIDRVEFDTVYHEHLSYFTLTSLAQLFKAHGLEITDVERLSIHGGSLRVTVEHDSPAARPTRAVEAILRAEHDAGVPRFLYYAGFRDKVMRVKHRLLAMLAELKSRGCRIAAYGASAKGATLLNFAGIGAETLDFVVDRSPAKQNRYAPGTHLKILSPDALFHRMPEFALLLIWNLAAEILDQQAEYCRRGGRFIVPVPDPKLL